MIKIHPRRSSIEASPIRRLVFWQNLNSHLQSPYLEELNRIGRYEVHWAVEKDVVTSDRAVMGWSSPSISFPLHVDPSEAEIQRLLNERPEESLHIFTSIFGEPLVRKAHRLAIRAGARIALLNEPPLPARIYRAEYGAGALRTALRPLPHRAHRRIYGRRVEAVWAIGHMAFDWYRSLDYSDQRIFSWAYCPPHDETQRVRGASGDERLSLVYVGQATSRKGADVLIEALAPLRGRAWRLRFVGDGPIAAHCKLLAQRHGIDRQIDWMGFLPHGDAMAVIDSSDLVVVPSRHDGWGAAVNEALVRGTAVVCTDRCGSADLVRDPARGKVVRAGDPLSLGNAIEGYIRTVGELRGSREGIRDWARCISAKSAASYFDDTIHYLNAGGPKPDAPWIR